MRIAQCLFIPVVTCFILVLKETRVSAIQLLLKKRKEDIHGLAYLKRIFTMIETNENHPSTKVYGEKNDKYLDESTKST